MAAGDGRRCESLYGVAVVDLLVQGAAWLNAQRHAHMSHSVTYARGGDTVELNATAGRTEFEQVDDYGIVHKIESRDFLIRATDLVLNSVTVLPAVGDRVTDGAHVYEVMPLGTEPPYRFSDAAHATLRIHTKYVADT